jgi:hypothetical protein
MTDQVKKLEDRVLQLTAENARLRQQLAEARKKAEHDGEVKAGTGNAKMHLVAPPKDTAEAVASASRLRRYVEAHLDAEREAGNPIHDAFLHVWLTDRKLIGRSVLWQVVLDRAGDQAGKARLKDIEDQLALARGMLASDQVTIDRIIAGTADPNVYAKLGREKTLAQLQKRVAAAKKEIPDLMLRQWDAETYTLRIETHDPADPKSMVKAYVHKDDLAALAKSDPGAKIYVEGIIRSVNITPGDAAGMTVELDRCRVR